MEITHPGVVEWLEEIKDAKKRDKDFRKKGEEINDIYDAEKSDQIPFNILYSNTETLKPALYSQTPRPVVKRRHNQDVSPAQAAAEKAGTRILEYFLDTNIDGYETFDSSMEDAVLDAALPGRGITQLKFDDVMDGDSVKWAVVCADSRKYDKVHFGYAKKWSKMPWIAFEDYLDEEEATELFGDKAKEIEYTECENDDDEKKDSGKVALVYQIWEKATKTIHWVSEQYDGFLLQQDDPLEISGFYNIPRPLQLHRKSNNLKVTALYSLYENQAKELNRITSRLNRVIEAIKARGVYDGSLGDELEKLMDEDDNALIPTDKGASLVEGGFDKSIWFMPIEKLVGVAQALITAREQTKAVIYEITGLSDVIRGQSRASETLGAQKIKESWGTMRLKNMQKEVQKYVRDSLRIMLDIASTKIPERLWGDLTGLDYPSAEEKEQAQMQLEQMKAQIEQKMQLAKAQGQQLPPPPPPPQELLKAAQSPSWTEILDILKDDFTRSYKIDIETNSTLDVEATEDKQQVSEFMNAMAQFMNGVQPMIENKTLPFGAAQSMLLEITRRFRFGIDVENEIKQMKEPQGPNPEQLKKQMEEFKKKTQETQKQFEARDAELKALEEKITEEKDKAGNDLDSQHMDLQKQKMQFEYDKKLFTEMQKLKDNAAKAQMAMKEQVAMAKQGANQVKAETKLKSIVETQSRNVQSMMDKHQSVVEKASDKLTQIPDKFAQNQEVEAEPKKKKVIKLIFGDDGKPNGATVDELDEEQENGEINFEYDDEGKPVGATVN